MKFIYLTSLFVLTRKSNPQITEWMENMNFSNDYSHLQAYYSSKLLKTVDKLDKKAIVWEGMIFI